MRCSQNLPPLEVVAKPYVWRRTVDPDTDGMLTGTDALVTINAYYGTPNDAPWKHPVQGTSGEQAGAAYVLSRTGDDWGEVSVLLM